MPRARIFLAHSSADKAFVDRLAFALESANIGVWYDKWEIRVGDSLLDKIALGLQSHDFIAVVLSESSVQSEWMRKELNAGLMRELSESKVVVLPILFADCKIPIFLKEKKYADFRADFEQGLDDLLIAVSDLSPAAIQQSKGFRKALYLISGLTSSDAHGTGTLNFYQYRSVYPYRAGLEGILGPEEKRLLFWSAVAFRAVNPNTPFFLDSTTPVWGMISGCKPEELAQWTIDGLGGPLFDYLIKYVRQEIPLLTVSPIDQIKESFLAREKVADELGSAIPPASSKPPLDFLIVVAEHDQEMFEGYLIPKLQEGRYGKNSPPVIEATGYLEAPLQDDFYSPFLKMDSAIATAAVRALILLKRPTAVDALRVCLKSSKIDGAHLDAIFGSFSDHVFVDKLHEWIEEDSTAEIKIRILVALANSGGEVDADLIRQLLSDKLQSDEVKYGFRVTIQYVIE